MSTNWIIKGNPTHYNWDKDLRPGYVERWGTRFPEPGMTKRDRVFLWESGGRSRIIGLAEVVRIEGVSHGKWRFWVKYLTERFEYMPGIDELRAISVLEDASFLKPAVFRTVYPLSGKQASAIYRTVVSCNPGDDIWRDISHVPRFPDIDLNLSAKEGRKKLVTHLQTERAPNLAPKKKAQFRKQHAGKLFCECCGQDYPEYGKHREAMFEVHHLKALGKAKKRVVTKLSDLAVICSNCHRVIHRHDPMISVAQLSGQLRLSTKA